MLYLTIGLFIFLGVHSLGIFAENWRAATRLRIGESTYRASFSLLSLLGLGLIVWGFGLAREAPTQLWLPPAGMRHSAALLNILAFVLLVAAYVPGNAIKARVHHPMVLGVKTWAFAHLLANGNLAHMVLFGAFLIWAVLDFISLRKRDRLHATQHPSGKLSATLLTVVLGVVLGGVFAMWLHGLLIGVKPF